MLYHYLFVSMFAQKTNRLFYCAMLSLLGFSACTSEAPPVDSAPAISSIEKLDIHTHFRADRAYLSHLLDEWNMKALLVDVVTSDSTGIKRSWSRLLDQQARYPTQFSLCSGFSAFGIDAPDYSQRIIDQLEAEIAAGAKMVKVWKNFGLVDKDESGQFVQIDDPRLQPIWDFLIEKNIPVLSHIGEPLQAWRPLQEGNPHYNYYDNHPEYHFYNQPDVPAWETIMAARDNWLAENPDLVVLGAHMGSMSHDLDEVAKRLDQFPNFQVETAARWGDITGQETEKVKAFFLKYQDRILYGTDLGSSGSEDEMSEENLKAEQDRFEKMWQLHWDYVSGKDSLYFDSPMISFPVSTKSLGLPMEVLEKFYRENALKLLKMK